LAGQKHPQERIGILRRALELYPDCAEAHCSLGNLLYGQGKHADAVRSFWTALQCRPDYADAWNNLGGTLISLGRIPEATVVLRQAVRYSPISAEVCNNLGQALAEQGRFREATAYLEKALRLKPRYADAHVNLANVYSDLGRHAEAMAALELALFFEPGSAVAHCCRALGWLQTADFEKGWQEWEWRWQLNKGPSRSLPKPRWDGSDLAGRTILLHREQGIGDLVQFVRYAMLVKQRGGKVIVECPSQLIRLCSSCLGVDSVIAAGSTLPDFDVQAPLMSLPGILGRNLATVPATVPYLLAEDDLIQKWRLLMKDAEGFKIGIAWQGNPRYRKDRHRSIPLARFAPLARVDGVRLISLQKGPGVEQLGTLSKLFPVTDFGGELDTKSGAFMDTAAIMKNVDLVVTSDTSIAHLAGALGVRVWVALSKVADWRWLLDREDSPWYPTMRLFRQTKLGDWDTVFQRIACEVKKLIRKERGQKE
jgi:hypothetical protein